MLHHSKLNSEPGPKRIQVPLLGPGITVSEVKLITDRETGESRGFGFVTMGNVSEGNAPFSWIVALMESLDFRGLGGGGRA